MNSNELRDLTQGENEWCNIQDIIRHTFITLNDLITKQQREIANIQAQLQQIQINEEERKVCY